MGKDAFDLALDEVLNGYQDQTPKNIQQNKPNAFDKSVGGNQFDFESYKKYPWVKRAMESGLKIDNGDGSFSTVKTITVSDDKQSYVLPTIRLIDGKLVELPENEAIAQAREKGDAIPFKSLKEAENFSKGFSQNQNNIQPREQTSQPDALDMALDEALAAADPSEKIRKINETGGTQVLGEMAEESLRAQELEKARQTDAERTGMFRTQSNRYAIFPNKEIVEINPDGTERGVVGRTDSEEQKVLNYHKKLDDSPFNRNEYQRVEKINDLDKRLADIESEFASEREKLTKAPENVLDFGGFQSRKLAQQNAEKVNALNERMAELTNGIRQERDSLVESLGDKYRNWKEEEAAKEAEKNAKPKPSIWGDLKKFASGVGEMIAEGFIGSEDDLTRWGKEEMREKAAPEYTPQATKDLREQAEKGGIGWIENTKRGSVKGKIPVLGATIEAMSSREFLQAVKRLETNAYRELKDLKKAEEWKRSDTAMVKDHFDLLKEYQRRGYINFAEAGDILANMPTFVIEMALTGNVLTDGLGAGGKAAVKEMIKKYGKKEALKMLLRGGGVFTGKLAAGTTLRLPFYTNHILAGTMKDIGPQEIHFDDAGKLIVDKAGAAMGKALFRNTGDFWVELFSEGAGRMFEVGGELASLPLQKLMKSEKIRKIADKLKIAMFNKWADKFKDNSFGKFMSWVRDKGNYNGMLGEMGEERLGDIIRAATDIDDFNAENPDNLLSRLQAAIPSGRQLATEAIGFGVPGVLGMGGQAANEAINKRSGQQQNQSEVVSPEEAQQEEEIPEEFNEAQPVSKAESLEEEPSVENIGALPPEILQEKERIKQELIEEEEQERRKTLEELRQEAKEAYRSGNEEEGDRLLKESMSLTDAGENLAQKEQEATQELDPEEAKLAEELAGEIQQEAKQSLAATSAPLADVGDSLQEENVAQQEPPKRVELEAPKNEKTPINQFPQTKSKRVREVFEMFNDPMYENEVFDMPQDSRFIRLIRLGKTSDLETALTALDKKALELQERNNDGYYNEHIENINVMLKRIVRALSAKEEKGRKVKERNATNIEKAISNEYEIDPASVGKAQKALDNNISADVKISTGLSDAEKGILKAAKEIYGKDIIFFEAEKDEDAAGIEGSMTLAPEDPQRIFIERHSPTPLPFLVAHEGTHQLEVDEPELYKKLENIFRNGHWGEKYLKHARKRKDTINRVNQRRKENGLKPIKFNNDIARSEFIADTIGEMATKKSFWEELRKSDVGLAEKLYNIIIGQLEKLKELLPTEANKQLNEVRKAYAEILKEAKDAREAVKRKKAERTNVYMRMPITQVRRDAEFGVLKAQEALKFREGDLKEHEKKVAVNRSKSLKEYRDQVDKHLKENYPILWTIQAEMKKLAPLSRDHEEEFQRSVPKWLQGKKTDNRWEGKPLDEALKILEDAGLLPENSHIDALLEKLSPYVDKTPFQLYREDNDGELNSENAFWEAQAQAEKDFESGKTSEEITVDDLDKKSKFTIKGEKYEVIEMGDQSLTLQDGIQITLPYEGDEKIKIDKGSLLNPRKETADDAFDLAIEQEISKSPEGNGKISPNIRKLIEDERVRVENRAMDWLKKMDSEKTVAAKFSVSENKTVIDSPEFKRWSKGAPVLEHGEMSSHNYIKGEPIVLKVYHGTTHDINTFDASIKGNKEGHFGAVNYFTSSEHDALDNYAGEGADLTGRIERRAERLESEFEYEYDSNEADFKEAFNIPKDNNMDIEDLCKHIARKELSGGGENVIPVFVRLDNPFVLNGDSRQFIELLDEDMNEYEQEAREDIMSSYDITEEELDNNIEEYEDEIQDIVWQRLNETPNKLVDAINNIAAEFNIDSAEVFTSVSDYSDGIYSEDLDKALREGFQYAEDYETGELISSHMVARVIQEMGFDGIIMNNANDQFSNMNMEPDTTHVHVFDENKNQIKSVDSVTYDDNGNVIPESERFDSSSSDIRFSLKDDPERKLTLEEIAKDKKIKATETILSPDGKEYWGEITEEIAEEAGIPQGQIKLLKGKHIKANNGFGVKHIIAEHKKDFEKYGYKPESYISNIISNFDEIWTQDSKRLLLVKHGRPKGFSAIELRPEKDGFYSVVTAFPEDAKKEVKGNKAWVRRTNRTTSKRLARSPLNRSVAEKPQPPLESHGEQALVKSIITDKEGNVKDFSVEALERLNVKKLRNLARLNGMTVTTNKRFLTKDELLDKFKDEDRTPQYSIADENEKNRDKALIKREKKNYNTLQTSKDKFRKALNDWGNDIVDRQEELIRYIQKKLPMEERGKMLAAIKNLAKYKHSETRQKYLFEAIEKADEVFNKYENKAAREDLKTLVEKERKQLDTAGKRSKKSNRFVDQNRVMNEYLNEISFSYIPANRDLKKAQAALDKFEHTGDDSLLAEIPKEVMDELKKKNVYDMSTNDILRTIEDIVAIRRHGRTVFDQRQYEYFNYIQDGAEKATGEIKAQRPKRGEKLKRRAGAGYKWHETRLINSMKQFHWGNIRPERIMEYFGGFKRNSTFKKMTFGKALDAEKDRMVGYERAHQAIDGIYKYNNVDARKAVKETFTEITLPSGEKLKLTYAQGMFFYANSQNPFNRAHLISSLEADDKTGAAILENIISKLPENYKNAVDQQIDYYDKIQYKRINDVFVWEHGVDMPKSERYFPIMNLEHKSEMPQFLSDMLSRYGSRAAIQKGMTVERSGAANAFRRFDYFGTVTKNLKMSEHYIAYVKPVKEISDFLNNRQVREAMDSKNSNAAHEVREWLKAIAHGKIRSSSGIGAVSEWLRTNYVVAVLGANLQTFTKQIPSIVMALPHLKKTDLFMEISKFLSSPLKSNDYVNEKSIMMRYRADSIEREIAELNEKRSGLLPGQKRVMDKARDLSMKHIQLIDKAVTDVIWMTKYREVMTETANEEEAIKRADEVIRKTQPMGGITHLPSNFRDNEILRLFSVFMNQLNQNANIAWELGVNWKEQGKMEKLQTAASLIASGLFIGAISNGFKLFPWEEPEEAAKAVINNVTGGIPLVGWGTDLLMTAGAERMKAYRENRKPNLYGTLKYKADLTPTPFQGLKELIFESATGTTEKAIIGGLETLGVPAIVQSRRFIKGFDNFLATGDPRYLIWSEYVLNTPKKKSRNLQSSRQRIFQKRAQRKRTLRKRVAVRN